MLRKVGVLSFPQANLADSSVGNVVQRFPTKYQWNTTCLNIFVKKQILQTGDVSTDRLSTDGRGTDFSRNFLMGILLSRVLGVKGNHF